ncbi:lysozyme [Telmatobacter bradus]|uniref:lysozyme n=1 Tax=Telmatobacter bradus TaxID=474953 RepID=UPI003B431D23
MQLSQAGLELIKHAEGFRGHTYLDGAGLPTIGYGHRLLAHEAFPLGINEAEAEHLLIHDLQVSLLAIERMVKVPLTQGQFDALVDFTFNLGAERLARSTLLRALNGGRYQAAGEQLLRWDLIDGKESNGLRQRRITELTLWNLPAPKPPVAESAPEAKNGTQAA